MVVQMSRQWVGRAVRALDTKARTARPTADTPLWSIFFAAVIGSA